MTALAHPGGRAIDPPTVLRRPEVGDERLMSRRGWWLAVAHLLVPGAAQVVAGDRRIGRIALGAWLAAWALALMAALLWLLLPQALLTLFLTPPGLTLVQAVIVAAAVAWALLTLDTLRLIRIVRVGAATRVGIAALLAVALVVVGGAAGWGAWASGVARGTVGDVFAGSRLALPSDGRYNIMLLGGDAGPGRSGLRPDSVSVMSIDAITGKTVTFGLPRNLGDVPFSKGSPMREEYPHGYGWHDTCDVDVCQLNSIYTEVQLKHPGRYPDAGSIPSSPGIEATRDAVEGALGIDIQYYVLVDMGSFDDLIDAMGGVTITVKQRIPLGGHIDSDGDLVGVKVWIEKGRKKLNGNRALWYARSRYGDVEGDYGRMKRQRELQDAMLHQMNPVTLLTRFDRVAKAGGDAVQTDVPQSLAGVMAGLAVKARGQKAERVELTPPRVRDPEHPDYDAVHAMVQKALR